MLAVWSRFRIFLIILLLVVLSILLWIFIAEQFKEKVPLKGVFVLSSIETEVHGRVL